MVVDLARCIGCQACTVSCIMENDVPPDSVRTIVNTLGVYDPSRRLEPGLWLDPVSGTAVRQGIPARIMRTAPSHSQTVTQFPSG